MAEETLRDGVLYSMSPDELLLKAQEIRSTETLVEAELGAMKANVVVLGSSWEGPAALLFQDLMVEWDKHATQLRQALLAIAGGLEGSSHNTTAAEHVNVSNLHGIQLPRARL
ncbi:WXG100 family type VII secretion target [Peterkaempfera griseoplana]|uniref:WXG100 family type VII secretion target n=1 Tax=Peterkaempfera griseoplana TaxID=66896 RepID=UPI0006E1B79E|nr:WXG100 family type VII secretion target [Peterkaempfera griseoplana]